MTAPRTRHRPGDKARAVVDATATRHDHHTHPGTSVVAIDQYRTGSLARYLDGRESVLGQRVAISPADDIHAVVEAIRQALGGTDPARRWVEDLAVAAGVDVTRRDRGEVRR